MDCINRSLTPIYKFLSIPNLKRRSASKKGDSDSSMGSKSKQHLMESYKTYHSEADAKHSNLSLPHIVNVCIKNKGNALDIASKSFLKIIKKNDPKSSGSCLSTLKSLIMSTLRNHVQLIGSLGHKPNITTTENGRKMARFTLATNFYYKTAKGEQKQETNWHNIVAWGRTAKVVEQYATKDQEIGVSDKLNTWFIKIKPEHFHIFLFSFLSKDISVILKMLRVKIMGNFTQS